MACAAVGDVAAHVAAAALDPAAVSVALYAITATFGGVDSAMWTWAIVTLPGFVAAMCVASSRQCQQRAPYLFASDNLGIGLLSVAFEALRVLAVRRLTALPIVALCMADVLWTVLFH